MPHYIDEFMNPIEVTQEKLEFYRKNSTIQRMKQRGITSLKDVDAIIRMSPTEMATLARLMTDHGLNQQAYSMI